MEQTAPRTARDIGVVGVAWHSLQDPAAFAAAARFVRTVVKDFFWLQFSVRLGVRKVPIVWVDHALDAAVPFEPDKIGVYLDFIAFWIRPLGLIGERFGRDAQRRYTTEYLALIERCYREAADVYAATMSTTRRPRYLKGRFLTIHLFDPHYLCVPSLHVMIVVLTHTFFRRAFAELGASEAEVAAVSGELFDGAVAITETVLYIKQHSVNCIPAALYAMARITPDAVTDADAAAYVAALFADAPSVAAGDVAAIRAHVSEVYGQLVADGASDNDWTPAVRRLVAGFGVRA